MQKSVAIVTQWVGRITVIIALGVLIWNFADIAGSNDILFGRSSRQNAYLQALSSSTSLAVSGMFAIALGMMLERFSNE